MPVAVPTRPRAGPAPRRGGPPIGVRQDAIEGRFRQISTHQLCLAWWLHLEGHITRRQLRVWFAAHEMHERRRYTAREADSRGRRRPRQAFYRLEELKGLVGGRGAPTADPELSADIRHLARLGLVKIGEQTIVFATSADQIAVDDLAGFWAMFDQVPNHGRGVPVPRRTLRALAGGFSRAVTGVMIALMIRSLFWHKEDEDYRIDGRTKGSWIANVFGLSRRAVTDARAHLVELGWLEPIAARQWELNRWGAHDRINVRWVPGDADEGKAGGGIASPSSDKPAEFASPDLNQSPSPSENLKTRNLGRRPDLAGVSENALSKKTRPKQPPGRAGAPSIRDIRPEHLRTTGDLLDLYAQAVKAGLAEDCEAGRLDFLSLAERARARGHNPGGMLRWLLTHKRFDFITQADEDAAAQRLRAWRHGQAFARADAREFLPRTKPKARALTEDDKLVRACLQVAAQRRIADPFWVARAVKPNWTRDEWDKALDAYEAAELERALSVKEG